jgi:K(+)-stimulated pyrophosphate-energized sodium pump
MILPGIYAICSPITVGFLIGPRCLVGMLGGAIASGMMLAIMMANAGGAWDNAKKYIEIEGAKGGKGTETHKACVVGDTVGDPFKDTSGPSLNILIKLMSIISLVIAPLMEDDEDWDNWYYGLIPLGFMIVSTFVVYHYFWREGIDIAAPIGKEEPTMAMKEDPIMFEEEPMNGKGEQAVEVVGEQI